MQVRSESKLIYYDCYIALCQQTAKLLPVMWLNVLLCGNIANLQLEGYGHSSLLQTAE